MKRCRLKLLNFQIKNDMSKENKTSEKQQDGNDFIADVSVMYCQCDELANINDSLIGINECVKCDKPIKRQY